MSLDWSVLRSDHYNVVEVLKAVKDVEWQAFRKSLRGKDLQTKYDMLKAWLYKHDDDHKAKVQVTNYVNALARAGLITTRKKVRPHETPTSENVH
jgi:hypothetical protein